MRPKEKLRALAWRARARLTSPSAQTRLVDALRPKRLIFCITAGRTGSKTLAALFAALDGVDARHEPRPDFVEALADAQSTPRRAREFLIGAKLPAIRRLPADRAYVETSHLFGKGFYEPLTELGLDPDLILLERDPRKVAASLVRLKTVPGRTELGRRFLIQPSDPNFLPVENWRDFSDYQLAYWYVLETAERQRAYAAQALSRGRRVARIDIDALNSVEAFVALAEALDLDCSAAARERLAGLVGRRENERRHGGAAADPSSQLDHQEAAVHSACRATAPIF